MTSAAPLSRDELLELLEDLSQTLARSDERARMFVVGGAAMSLGYDQTRTTHDVDALRLINSHPQDRSELRVSALSRQFMNKIHGPYLRLSMTTS